MPFSFFSYAWIFDWVQSPTWRLAGLLFVNLLWIPLIWWLLRHEIWDVFTEWTWELFDEERKWILLAIDTPRDGEQTPAAMEAVFNQLAGAHGTETWWEKNIGGESQDWFAFEIISIEGYVQYVIRCVAAFRDLVESAVYAQYPDAEITEVRDYVKDVPSQWPNDKLDYFGTEYKLQKPEAFAIKTYKEFEDKVRGEYVDPMSGMLEAMGKIGKGEQVWYQICAKPIVDADWIPDAQSVIDEFVEKNVGDHGGGHGGHGGGGLFKVVGKFFGLLFKPIELLVTGIFPDFGGGEAGHSDSGDKGPRTNVLMLTPGEKKLVEEAERKLSKIAYKCRIRIMYFGPHDIFSKPRGTSPIIGAIKQFNDQNMNWFKVGKKSWTKANYTFKRARKYVRQRNMLKAYQNRSFGRGEVPGGFVLNSEELATIYHFPVTSVKAPLLKRAVSRKSEPPPTLPVDLETREIEVEDSKPAEAHSPAPLKTTADHGHASKEKGEPALPSVPDAGIQFIDIPDEH